MDMAGYINPRSIGNKEPNELFGMDIFIEDAVWKEYVADRNIKTQNTRTWDICWMLRASCSSPATIQRAGSEGVEFRVILQRKEVVLRAYIHPEMMAFCVGMPITEVVEQ
jgi:hypothetical protein